MPRKQKSMSVMKRGEFLKLSTAGVGGIGIAAMASAASVDEKKSNPGSGSHSSLEPKGEHSRPAPEFNGEYSGERLNRVAFPMGGFGAGMICFEGTGALSHVSLRNKPEVFNEPCTFAALCVKGAKGAARVLEGPVPNWKKFGSPNAGNGAGGASFGLPRFREARFSFRFPFGTVTLSDKDIPLKVQITGWSPFEPGDADNASLPVAALEYTFTNPSDANIEAVFSWSARNFMTTKGNPQAVKPIANGFMLWGGPGKDTPKDEGAFVAAVADDAVKINHAWFRGGWFDSITMAWKDIESGACYERAPITDSAAPAPGATLFVPFTLKPGASKTIALRFCWYVGKTDLRAGKDAPGAPSSEETKGPYRPWYAGRFADVSEVAAYWRDHYKDLRQATQRFSDCFYDSSLPPEVLEAVAANLTILKSPTVLRQADGRLWTWEGCSDGAGCCAGSCTHVWN
ncbi:MAG: GH116 family glycosyl-hydrolase, partial [Candidatus Sumerlaeota bacterium]|nr:GH116 family glycosyl-hydrolase [Candidatus Sumerlaeota bacterium]